MAIADAFAAYLAAKGYDPRSSRHSDFLSEIIVRDLVTNCPLITERATRGQIVAKLRHHQQIGQDDWVIDIAIGTCAGQPMPPEDRLALLRRELGALASPELRAFRKEAFPPLRSVAPGFTGSGGDPVAGAPTSP